MYINLWEVPVVNAAYENLISRRSVRKYKPEQISEAELDAVLRAGTYAPTAMGKQSPLIVAVQDPGDIARLDSLNAQISGRPGHPFYGAPTVVIVFAEAHNPNGVQDASLVMGNMLNAAHALGLGACWINRARETFELPEGRALLAKWGIEGDWRGVGNCILGYPDGPLPEAAPRREGYVKVIK